MVPPPPQSVPPSSNAKENRTIGMRSLIVIAIGACLLAMVLASPARKGNDHFNLLLPQCGGHGVFKDGKCHCSSHFHGEHCEIYHSRRCTKDEECGFEHAYCMTKMMMQCRFSSHCKDPSGWCVPLDPKLPEHGR
ncbi:hypothetical protein PRIPAC_84561, partial [Pristionchus pacificus]|uniref:Uncharacterized protein n=1 Tax=Pristionchus pacificus TaxID=54126 RepID=A0A2A6BSB0_PRIPA